MQWYECNLVEFIDDLKQKDKNISSEIIFRIIAQLLIALEKLHSKNIVHRDIKSLNILIRKIGPKPTDLQVSLGDFGLGKKNEKTDKMTYISFNGTPSYMAPELVMWDIDKITNQLRRSQICKIDVWAIGVVFYELLF